MEALKGREAILKSSLARCDELLALRGDNAALSSISAQLNYLLEVANGASDPSRLKLITLGRLAAREIEDIDMAFAEQLFEISAVIDEINSRRGR